MPGDFVEPGTVAATSLVELTPGLIEKLQFNLSALLAAETVQIKGNGVRATTTDITPEKFAQTVKICDDLVLDTKQADLVLEFPYGEIITSNRVDFVAEDQASGVQSQVMTQIEMAMRETLNKLAEQMVLGSGADGQLAGWLQIIDPDQIVFAGGPLDFDHISDATARNTFNDGFCSVWVVNGFGFRAFANLFMMSGAQVESTEIEICKSTGEVVKCQVLKALNQMVLRLDPGVPVFVAPLTEVKKMKEANKHGVKLSKPLKRDLKKEFFNKCKVFNVHPSHIHKIDIEPGFEMFTMAFKVNFGWQGTFLFTPEQLGDNPFVVDQVRVPGTQKLETTVRIPIGQAIRSCGSLSMIDFFTLPEGGGPIIVNGFPPGPPSP